MGERFIELYRLPSGFYAEGSPVYIETGAVRKDTQTDKVFVQLKVCSISAKTIKACEVGIKAYVPGGE